VISEITDRNSLREEIVGGTYIYFCLFLMNLALLVIRRNLFVEGCHMDIDFFCFASASEFLLSFLLLVGLIKIINFYLLFYLLHATLSDLYDLVLDLFVYLLI
jgi:hypothetical protein